jgi:7-carboxy-7-deazaguanine synthase
MPPSFPVVEIFGPTLQGEGQGVGSLCSFVRFGGCDLDCFWCDSSHAVDPAQVRKAPRMAAREILARIEALPSRSEWVVLTGGNPALFDLSELVALLRAGGYQISVETQGTKWAPWLRDVDLLCVSPKPPSSRMPFDRLVLIDFVARLRPGQSWFLKAPVLGSEDLAFAMQIRDSFVGVALYLSVVRLPGESRDRVLERTRWLLLELPSAYPATARRGVCILPQLHFLLWGDERGH